MSSWVLNRSRCRSFFTDPDNQRILMNNNLPHHIVDQDTLKMVLRGDYDKLCHKANVEGDVTVSNSLLKLEKWINNFRITG